MFSVRHSLAKHIASDHPMSNVFIASDCSMGQFKYEKNQLENI